MSPSTSDAPGLPVLQASYGTNDPSSKAPDPPATKAPRLEALGFMRFFCAVSIIAYHCKDWFSLTYRSYTWVAFFFVLSGFVLTYGQLNSATPATVQPLRFMERRLTQLYPLYALSLVLIYFANGQRPFDDPKKLLVNLSLMHAWYPNVNVNDPSWYISALATHWLAWLVVYPLLYRFNLKATCGLLGLTTLASVSFGIHHNGHFENKTPTYAFSLFMAGMCLAKCFTFKSQLFSSLDHATFLVSIISPVSRKRYDLTATVALLGLMIASVSVSDCSQIAQPPQPPAQLVGFQHNAINAINAPSVLMRRASGWPGPANTITDVLPWNCKSLGWDLGVMFTLPLQMMLIWGLSVGEDPLAKVFKQPALSRLDSISYALYILQVPLIIYPWRDNHFQYRDRCLALSGGTPEAIRFFVFALVPGMLLSAIAAQTPLYTTLAWVCILALLQHAV